MVVNEGQYKQSGSNFFNEQQMGQPTANRVGVIDQQKKAKQLLARARKSSAHHSNNNYHA